MPDDDIVDHEPVVGAPPRGSVVVYAAGTRPDGSELFRIAGVSGPVVVDPDTGNPWVGVRLPTSQATGDVTDCVAVTNIVSSS